MKSNGRSKKEDIAVIKERVRLINEKLGTKFYANWDDVWKVWTMHEIGPSGNLIRNNLGFDIGKSMEGMYEYTDGIFRFWDFMRYNKPTIEKW